MKTLILTLFVLAGCGESYNPNIIDNGEWTEYRTLAAGNFLWTKKEFPPANFKEATAACTAMQARLPTMEEFGEVDTVHYLGVDAPNYAEWFSGAQYEGFFVNQDGWKTAIYQTNSAHPVAYRCAISL